jgi:hypothetical protein
MKDAGKFKKWLTKRGAVVLDTTNQWEVVRFKTVNGVSVIYTKANGRLTFTGESDEAYTAYKANKVWKAVDRKRVQLRQNKARLANRDGKKCFCCNEKLGFDELTIEHLLSFSHGGTDNDNNLCLVCKPCNRLLGNLPVARKIELIMQRRQGLGTIESPEGYSEFSTIDPKALARVKPPKNKDIIIVATPQGENHFSHLFRFGRRK